MSKPGQSPVPAGPPSDGGKPKRGKVDKAAQKKADDEAMEAEWQRILQYYEPENIEKREMEALRKELEKQRKRTAADEEKEQVRCSGPNPWALVIGMVLAGGVPCGVKEDRRTIRSPAMRTKHGRRPGACPCSGRGALHDCGAARFCNSSAGWSHCQPARRALIQAQPGLCTEKEHSSILARCRAAEGMTRPLNVNVILHGATQHSCQEGPGLQGKAPVSGLPAAMRTARTRE